MASRARSGNLQQHFRYLRTLLSQRAQQQPMQCRGMASERWKTIWPQTRFLNRPSLFSPTIIMEHWECIPIIVCAVGGVICEALWTIRLAMTRDDVRSLLTKKMAIDNHDYTARDRPPQRKFVTYRNKIEWPPGLMAALAAMRGEDLPGKPEPDKAKKKK